MKISLYGFTLLRNGVKYDYCFEESLKSLAGVSEKVYLALGAGEDSTEEKVQALPKIHSIPTVWDDSLREGGLILSQQTNIALDGLRADHGENEAAWGFYLQCDEVLHEDDYELIKRDVQKAQDEGCDTIAFRYLHFWQSHHEIAINKKWYPQEIRCVKLKTSIESWGDAQTFRHHQKVYYSEARIFHYGHVREESSYHEKKRDILRLYHADHRLSKYKRRERRYDNQTETLTYLGPHPQLMQERIERLGEKFQFPIKEHVYIVGEADHYSDLIKNNIRGEQVHWVSTLSEVPKRARASAVLLNPNLWQKFRYRSLVPEKMRSPLALPWNPDFILTLKLSEKGIGVS